MTDNPTPNDIALLREALEEIAEAGDAYPKSVFPEPDWDKAHQLLTAGGMTLDAIAASNMRFVANRLSAIAKKALAPGQHDGAAGEGLTITDDEIDDAIAHGFGERFTERAQSATPKPSTEQARAAFNGEIISSAKAYCDAMEIVRADPIAALVKLIDQARADGYVLVPREPTKAMVEAGDIASWDDGNHMPAINLVRSVWTAMLDAAATPSGADALGGRL